MKVSNLKGKKILITGAGNGIGKATALKLAEYGPSLFLLGGRNEENLYSVRDKIMSLGSDCVAVPGDLTDSTTLSNGLSSLVSSFGGIDILINNAGMAYNSPFESITEKMFDDIMNLDVKVPFFLTQMLLPYLRKSDYATIVNIASVVGHTGYANQSSYSMAKHAVIGFSQSLAKEVYKDGIRVHVISPGGVYTDMVKATRPDLTGDNMILPTDVADVIFFLLNNRSNAIIDEICMHRINKEPF